MQHDHLSRPANGPDFRRKLAGLSQALAIVERNFAVGGPDGVPTGLLRDLVALTARLAGADGWRPTRTARPSSRPCI